MMEKKGTGQTMQNPPWYEEKTDPRLLEALQNGLPPNKLEKKTVTVIGAGMAGLITAKLLRVGITFRCLNFPIESGDAF